MRLVLVLSAAVLNTAAVASDLPKEGKVTGTYSSAGSYKPITAGKNMVASIFDESGFTVGPANTLLDHLTWRCIGVYTAVNGDTKVKGNCVGTDPSGDQIFTDFTGDPGRADAQSISGKATYVDGTGKYAGISGGESYTLHGPEFKVAPELTYVQYGPIEGNYKLK